MLKPFLSYLFVDEPEKEPEAGPSGITYPSVPKHDKSSDEKIAEEGSSTIHFWANFKLLQISEVDKRSVKCPLAVIHHLFQNA